MDDLAECERIARAIIPDWPDTTPIYIVDASTLTGRTDPVGASYGVCHQDLDLVVRPFIDNWRGRGVAMVINSAAIRADRATSIVGVCLHEAAHAIERNFLGIQAQQLLEDTPPLSTPMLTLAAMSAFVRTTRDDTDREYEEVKSIGDHNAAWLRAVLHLRWRAAWILDLMVGIHDVAGSTTYDPGPCHTALLHSGECEKLQRLPLRDVLSIPPPQSFLVAWAEAMADMSKTLPTQQPQRTTATMLLDVKNLETARTEERQAHYSQLVSDLADGTDHDPGDILDALESVGKTSDDLLADVDRLKRRRLLVDQMNAAKAARAARADAFEELETMDQAFEAMRRQHEEDRFPLVAKIQRAEATVTAAFSAEPELRRTCSDDLKRRKTELSAQIQNLDGHRQDIRQRIGRAETAHRTNIANRNALPDTESTVARQLRDGDLARTEQQLAELREQQAAVMAAMLKP